jgi:hypothetical protein
VAAHSRSDKLSLATVLRDIGSWRVQDPQRLLLWLLVAPWLWEFAGELGTQSVAASTPAGEIGVAAIKLIWVTVPWCWQLAAATAAAGRQELSPRLALEALKFYPRLLVSSGVPIALVGAFAGWFPDVASGGEIPETDNVASALPAFAVLVGALLAVAFVSRLSLWQNVIVAGDQGVFASLRTAWVASRKRAWSLSLIFLPQAVAVAFASDDAVIAALANTLASAYWASVGAAVLNQLGLRAAPERA